MPKSTAIYTLVSIDDKNDPVVEEFEFFAALKARMKDIQPNDPQYKLLKDGRPVTFEWGEPELIIGGAPTPTAKPRAPRSDKGTRRKKGIDGVVDLAAKVFNGAA